MRGARELAELPPGWANGHDGALTRAAHPEPADTVASSSVRHHFHYDQHQASLPHSGGVVGVGADGGGVGTGGGAGGDADDAELAAPLLLAGGESYEFAALANLDLFFHRVYRFWHERGLRSILLSGALNLLALAFTAAFSSFLLLFVDWRALHAECLAPRAPGGAPADPSPTPGASSGCDLAAVALDRRPLLGRGLGADVAALGYLGLCAAYLLWTAAHFVADARAMREVAAFVGAKLGISEARVAAMTWAEVAGRLVTLQRSCRLCIARDLDELDIVARIMRKDNYLIAMLNRNVLQLHLQPPHDAPQPVRTALGALLSTLGAGGGGSNGGSGGGGRAGSAAPPLLTRSLEWNLRWAVLDHLFDERFRLRPEALDVRALRRRLRLVAAANALLSPFLLLFMLAHFAMRHGERLYRHPAAIGSRRWSGAARWSMRQLNELPHYLTHRLSASHPAALRYVAQFPSHTAAAVARFLVFVTGSFVALLLFMTFLDESLLERPLAGRQVVWWLGTSTLLLAACRTLVSDEPVAYDPERALAEVVSYTHHLPRAWRGRAHTDEVQSAFLSLFRLRVALLVEEIASLVTTPLLLAFSLPACAEGIVEFVSAFTVHVEGLGDVCSLSLFDLARHGNAKYGSPVHADKALRSRQGKLEKSLLTFVATYPTWRPPELAARMLANLAAAKPAAVPGGGGNAAGGGGGGGKGQGEGEGEAAGGERKAAAAAGGEDAASWRRAVPYVFCDQPPTAFPYQAAAPAAEAAAATGRDAAAAAVAAAATAALSRTVAGGAYRTGGELGGGPAAAAGGGAPRPQDGPALHPPQRHHRAAQYYNQPPPQHQLPYNMLPYHGVRSFTSNASASQMSVTAAAAAAAAAAGAAATGAALAAGAAGTDGGRHHGVWPRRGPPGGGAAAPGGLHHPPLLPPHLGGPSPSPSVASSQFSHLAPQHVVYYPVPLYYAHQQQVAAAARQQQQQQQQQLGVQYGGGTRGRKPYGSNSAFAPHLLQPYGNHQQYGGGGAWQRVSMPHGAHPPPLLPLHEHLPGPAGGPVNLYGSAHDSAMPYSPPAVLHPLYDGEGYDAGYDCGGDQPAPLGGSVAASQDQQRWQHESAAGPASPQLQPPNAGSGPAVPARARGPAAAAASTRGADSPAAGAGSGSSCAPGCGSDVLDMRGLEPDAAANGSASASASGGATSASANAAAAPGGAGAHVGGDAITDGNAGDDEDPLGGAAEWAPPPPPPPPWHAGPDAQGSHQVAAASRAAGTPSGGGGANGGGEGEELFALDGPDGYGMVPSAAAPLLPPQQHQQHVHRLAQQRLLLRSSWLPGAAQQQQQHAPDSGAGAGTAQGGVQVQAQAQLQPPRRRVWGPSSSAGSGYGSASLSNGVNGGGGSGGGGVALGASRLAASGAVEAAAWDGPPPAVLLPPPPHTYVGAGADQLHDDLLATEATGSPPASPSRHAMRYSTTAYFPAAASNSLYGLDEYGEYDDFTGVDLYDTAPVSAAAAAPAPPPASSAHVDAAQGRRAGGASQLPQGKVAAAQPAAPSWGQLPTPAAPPAANGTVAAAVSGSVLPAGRLGPPAPPLGNETTHLQARLAAGHALLDSLYQVSSDEHVRQQQQQHSNGHSGANGRDANGRGGTGSGGSGGGSGSDYGSAYGGGSSMMYGSSRGLGWAPPGTGGL